MTNPTLISVPFANGGNKNTIQTTRQAGQDAQDATWTDGFPSVTMTPISAGGLPPKGLDFNGIFYALSDNVVHRLKGLSVQFSATYATAIGGYPVGSKLELNDGSAIVISTVANNMTDPNSSMTGWAYYSGSASIVNNLTSTDATRPLSAAQGKVLNDSKLNITDFQKQAAIISAASGTSDAITASYTPAITALTNGMSLFVRASAANTTATPTFTPNSGTIAAKTIVKGAGSALAAGDIAGGGHWIELQYDATLGKWVLLNPATGISISQASVSGVFSGLKISTVGISNYNSVITANSVVLKNSSGAAYLAQSVNVTGNINTVGANGLDTGTLAASTWYYVHVIYNPTTQTTAALFSLSATAPTLPSGYTFSARVGAVRTDSTANKYLLQTLQYGNRVQYAVLGGSNTVTLPAMASGVLGTWNSSVPTYVAVSVSGFVPPTAALINLKILKVLSGAGSNMGIAPNANYSGITTSNPPVYSGDGGSAAYDNSTVSFMLESANIYAYSSSASGLIQCLGWEDNL